MTGPISCVESSITENRHLAEAKHDFSAFLLVNKLTHWKSVV